ncbi:Protein sidekick-1 [Metarhizium anisopliae]|nr:Protein sidekick-1 [Metarhizium anisopliae]
MKGSLHLNLLTACHFALLGMELIAASVAVDLERPSQTPAIPVPSNLTDSDEYAFIKRLLPALPPLQVHASPDPAQAVADVISWTSNSPAVGKSLDTRQSSLRVLVVGDSITQGLEGDWTWRYRMWQWFQQNGLNAQFVGPYAGTVKAETPSPPRPPPLYKEILPQKPYVTDGGYAKGVEGAFLSNSNHFAIWGRAAAVSKGLIQDVLHQHNADLMLLMLGFNDMGWFYSDADGTIDSMDTLVSNARAANPNIKIAIANVPQRSYIGGREDLIANTNIYNNLLPIAIKKWSTDQSPIKLVDIAGTYDCRPGGCPAGYDGLHPNALGEFQIASAFSKTLVNDFNLGSRPLAVPALHDASLVRDLPVPSNFKVFSSPQGVTATWDPVYGAHSYDIKVSINGGGNGFSATTSRWNRWDSQWPLDGWTYAVAVRASAGDSIKGHYTGTQSAVAKPQLAPAPANIQVQPTDSGITVTWDPPSGAFANSVVGYNVIYWDWAANRCQFINGAAFKSSPAVITGLDAGTNYLVAVETWNANGQGVPATVNNAVPGAGTPPVPGGLTVDSKDPTTVRIAWTGSDSAGGYHVWIRNINKPGSELQSIANVTEVTCHEVAFLFPGVWNFAFAISAYNGNLESDHGTEVIAPSPVPGGSDLTCAPKQPWCPSGGSVSIPSGFATPAKTRGPTVTTSVPIDTAMPIVINGHCTGPDCHNGQCSGKKFREFSDRGDLADCDG